MSDTASAGVLVRAKAALVLVRTTSLTCPYWLLMGRACPLMMTLVYKDSALIERLIEPTAKILDKIKPIRNLKAGKEKPWKK